MKDAVLIVPRYLLLFALVLLVLALFVALVSSTGFGWSEHTAPRTLEHTWLPATIVSLFLSAFFVPSRAGARLISLLVLILFAGAILVFGLILTDQLCADCPEEDIVFPFADGEIQPIGSGAIFTASTRPADLELDGVVRFRYPEDELIGLSRREDSAPFALDYYPTASYYPETDLLNATGEPIPITPADPVLSPLTEPPAMIGSLVEDIVSLNGYLAVLRERSLEFFAITCVALVAFAVSCLSFSHLSRWGLVNFVLSVLMFRLLFLLFDLFSGELIGGLLAPLELGLLDYLPAFSFLVLAVLCMTADLLFLRGDTG